MSVAALETVGLGKRYLRRWALEDCTLRIPRGHVVGLVGPNGAGKSTLLNLAAGLLAPTAGSIVVLGEEPARDAAQRAQLSLTIALAKRPELLLLDEPVSSLDPLARREFLGLLMSTVAGNDVSIVLSSHLVNDIEHHRLVGTRSTDDVAPANQTVIAASVTDRQRLLVVRSDGPVVEPEWVIESINLEDLVLAYMGQNAVRQDPLAMAPMAP